ncbi:DUF6049 family protein [Streptomyces sp. NPDC093228]|uniref:DUF6049 family protein n=1 Tax=unclassified Streptomyces TaxID=2593676 RepID=UPI000E2293FD|nr:MULTISPECIES: DUF6049 family protein [unclassified Streptomyces]MDX3258992.1 DUF6049 family protein [Streptomyces sp. MI02-2A]REE62082.1 hypothetical protein BX257_4694 [Streptomyces sp. 3212.3]
MAEAADFQGMSPSPARRWLRRTGALLAGAPLLAGLLQLPANQAAQAAEKGSPAQATGSRTVSVSVDSLTPSTPTDRDTLTVSGTVTNNGKQSVTDAHVGLRVAPTPLYSRAAIADAADRTGYRPGSDGSELGGKYVTEFDKLAPGVSQPFSISVPVEDLDLGSDGVYQLGVSLSGETASQPYEQVLGIQRTFLPWQPDGASTKTRTTFLWPLISGVHMTAETLPNQQQTPVFQNDDLARELAPGGRLSQLLSLGKDLDVTWVIDPDLLASVDAMTGSYSIKGEGDKVTAGKNQAIAKQWLSELEKAVQDKEVVALPFADPDLASLAHNGRNVTGSLSHLKDATDVASSTVETILHVKPDTEFAWPVDGAIDPSIVKVATSAGADKVIARSDSLQDDQLSYTPTAARPIGGGTTAVVADAGLSTLFRGDMTSAADSTLAVQKFLAQSLMINLQKPDRARSIVVAPQRMPSADQAQSMAQAVRTLQGGGWSLPADLSDAAKAKPDPGATTKVPSVSRYPSSLRKAELPQSAFQQIEETQDKLDSFKVILSDPSRVVTPFGRAIDRSVSTQWRGHVTKASTFRQGVEAYLEQLTSQVRLIQKSETKLSGRSATIPVTVQNNLMQGVDHLVLRLTSQQPTRLKIGNGPYSEQPITVSGGHSQSVKFTTTANANGRAAVVAQLFTEDGRAYGPAVTFDVNVTEITPTVMLVIAGGVLLLVLAGFRMYTQRKRLAARRAEEEQKDDPDGPDGASEEGGLNGAGDGTVDTGGGETSARTPGGESDAETGADDREQPSDPTPDTATESADPSGAGERVDR